MKINRTKLRGMLENISKNTKRLYKKHTGLELDLLTLRLLPYLFNQALNATAIDIKALKKEELPLVKTFTERKLCICFPDDTPVIFCDKEFYKIVCKILYEGYIDLYSLDQKKEGEDIE